MLFKDACVRSAFQMAALPQGVEGVYPPPPKLKSPHPLALNFLIATDQVLGGWSILYLGEGITNPCY